jgi:predicted ATPase
MGVSFLKIAVIGSQGVGKSTLIEEFVRRRPEYAVIPEMARDMIARSHGAVASWLDFQLELLANKVRAEADLRDVGNVISDRTAVDNWAFAVYHRVFPETMMYVFGEFSIAYANSYYDLFVYLPADDIPFSEERDGEMRAGVDESIRTVLPRLESVVTPRGSVEERVVALLTSLPAARV